jgi:hypothetical protein
MCAEFLLALIYLITILVINFFLFKLLKNYMLNILELVKIKNILQLYNRDTNNLLVSFYYLNKNKNLNNNNMLVIKELLATKNPNKKDDLLIISNFYDRLLDFTKINLKNNKEKKIFFNLLKKHYLSETN